jgi:hypothetical protein
LPASGFFCKRAKVTFSGLLDVKKIKLIKIAGETHLEMPLTERKYDRKTKKYSNIKIIPNYL